MVIIVVITSIIILANLCAIIWPEIMWYLSEGWMYKNVEPSGCLLTMTRIGGVVGVILGVAILLFFTGGF